MNIKKLLNKCFNEYDHVGEFVFHGQLINVFRECGHYVTNENDGFDPKWIEGSENVIAIVNEEYATNWYYPCDEDLKYAMSDAIKWIFDKKNLKLKFKITGDVNNEYLNNRRGIKGQIKEDLKSSLINFIDDLDSIEIENVEIDRRWPEYPDCKFVATIDGKWDLYELLINNNIMDNYCEGCIDLMKLEIYNEDDQKLFEDMFTYKIDFL